MIASSLTTDLYQLTMMAGYFVQGRHERTIASFELFTRNLPPHRNYLVAAGAATFVEYLQQLRFSAADVDWLRRTPALAGVPAPFFEYLREFRFTGDIWGMPEGTPVFAHEPIVRVTAPIAQAQLVETAALAFVAFQTTIASKASRVVAAARGRPIMEFGARRAHGIDAALFAARSAYLAGVSSTSFVEAGRAFGIPLSGTTGHSWIMSAECEAQAFTEFSALFGEHSALLLDTYDTVEAARRVVSLNLTPAAVRLDSGDLLSLSRKVREILDAGGLAATKILASGDLDEYAIADLIEADAPIDGFGVGTRLVTSEDAPALGAVYKLVEVSDFGVTRGVVKTSEGKSTWPGRKQVWRLTRDGTAIRDVVNLTDEPDLDEGRPLLTEMMRQGRATDGDSSLESARRRCARLVAELPADTRSLAAAATYPVGPSAALLAATRELQAR